MASKKVFTSLAFQADAKLIAPKVEQRSPAATLTDPTDSAYYTGSAGQLAYGGDNNIYVHNGSGWKALHHAAQPFSTDQVISSTVAGSPSSGDAPFVVASTKVVANLNADLLDGATADNAAGGNLTIPVRDAGNQFHVGTATAGTHVTNKDYVDSVAQGLTIIDPCYHATAAALPACTYANGTAGVGATLTANANAALTIDGTGASAGKRVLVKDQATELQNGIYTVTNAGGSSAAFVLTRATDYDQQGEIIDGDFVFTQEGVVNANRGFVQTANYWTASTGTMGTHAIQWTQFSGAGQITAGDGLAKSGDTLSVGVAAPISIVSDNVTIADLAITGAKLANNTVTSTQLADSITLTGLTVNGLTSSTNLTLDSGTGEVHSSKLIHKGSYAENNGIEFKQSSTTYGNNQIYFRAQAATTGIVRPVMTIQGSGLVGIGEDATSPSGTLHVSTARYGSELIDNPDFNTNNSDWTNASTSTFERNTTSPISGSGDLHWQGNGSGYPGAISNSFTLTSGRKYRVKLTYRVAGGSAYLKFGKTAGPTSTSVAGVSETGLAVTSNTSIDIVISPTETTTAYLILRGNSGTSTVEMYVDAVSVKEDNLDAGVDSDGNDLVVSGISKTGISIISRAAQDAALYFGDGLDNDFSSIASVRALDGTGTLKLNVNGSAGIEIDESQNVKIPTGGLGVGTEETTAGSIKAKADGARIQLESNDFVIAALTRQGTTGNAADQGALELYNSSLPRVGLYSNATSYFNGGNVAIGNTAANVHAWASKALTVDATGSNHWGAVEVLGRGTGGGAILFGDDSVLRTSITSPSGSHLTFNTNTSNSGTGQYAQLTINNDGTQDHYANPIVNSASIQGLQDGACYDFDGTGYITCGTASPITTGDFTVSAWVKIKGGTTSGTYAVIQKGVHQGDGFYLRVDDKNGGGLCLRGGIGTTESSTWGAVDTPNTGASLQVSRWYHVVAVFDRSDKLTTYIDGVQDKEVDISARVSTVASSYSTVVGATYASPILYEWKGQLRDVKVFPSKLEAGDVRKLYSGENPKKNLNVELVTNGDFGAALGSEWDDRSQGTLSLSSGQLLITPNSGGFYAGAQQSFATPNAAYYLLSVERGTTTGASGVQVGTASGTSATSYNLVNDHSSTLGVHRYVFKATSNPTYITLQTSGTANGTAKFDNVSVQEVGTLVDFNSRSASSTKWYNQAIPSLYNGTLQGGVTLSAGNTYWNNIKQVGSEVELAGPTTFKEGIIFNGEAADNYEIKYIGPNNFNIANTAGDIYLIANNTPHAHFSGGSGSQALKLEGKLGVGGVASNYKLEVHNSGADATAYIKGTNNNANARLMIDAYDASFIDFGRNGLGRWRLKRADGSDDLALLKMSNADWASTAESSTLMFWDYANSRVGIGLTNPDHSVQIGGAAPYYSIRPSSSAVGEKGGFHWSNEQATGNAASIVAEREALSNAPHSINFYTRNSSSVMGKKLTLTSDGTHNHYGGRIVNSQTVNDSHRTAEPSLHFSGTKTPADSRVAVTRKLLYGAVTFTAWVKTTSTDTSVDYAGNTPATIIGDAHGGVIHSFGLYNGSVKVVHYDGGWTDKNVRSATLSQVNDGKWHQVGYTWDLSDGAIQIYIDGVAVAHDGADNNLSVGTYNWVAYNMIGAGAGGSNNTTPGDGFDGEIKDVRIHNRALDSDEVAAAYNGESTPWKYEDAAGEKIKGVGVNFATACANVGAFNTAYNGSANGNMYSSGPTAPTIVVASNAATITNTSTDSGNGSGIRFSIGAINGKKYRLKLNVSAITGTFYVKAYNSGWVNLATINSTGAKNFELDPWAYSDASLYLIGGAQNNAITITAGTINNSLAQIGEVAAYTPRSINDKWYDTTSNANHGTITGATTVGDNDYRGILTVKGDSPKGGTHGTPTTDWANTNSSGAIYLGETTAAQGRLDYDYSASDGSTCLSLDNTFSNAGAKTSFGMKTAGTRLPVLELIGDGTVKATSGTSTNLKQVARVFTKEIKGGTPANGGNATATNTKLFSFDHGLGTEYITVSVAHTQAATVGERTQVECLVHTGEYWSDSANSNAGGWADSPNNNHCVIEFATAPANGVVYDITVIG